MNAVKTLFVVGVLAAVAYGVYVSIMRGPDANKEQSEAPPWQGAPLAQVPGPEAIIPQFPSDASGGQPPAYFAGPSGMGNPPAASGNPPGGNFVPPTNPPTPVPAHPGVPGSYLPPAAGSPNPGPPGYGSPTPDPAWDARTAAEASGQLEPGRNLLRDNGQTLGNPLPGRSPGLGSADDFATVWQAILGQLDSNQLAAAHLALSRWYNHPDVPIEQASKVIDLLDQLAGTVIYSQQHLLEEPYTVAQLDTPEGISRTFQVPWQVLARINGIDSPQQLQPGQQLKVVRGPFRAEVDLHNMELTLFLQERYAGRFPIGVGLDHRDLTGSYIVRRKGASPRYVGPDQATYEADDPANPYGRLLIGLQDLSGRETGVAIHGTNDPANLHRIAGRGAIRLSDQDIDDVFGILSENSRVDIRGASVGQ